MNIWSFWWLLMNLILTVKMQTNPKARIENHSKDLYMTIEKLFGPHKGLLVLCKMRPHNNFNSTKRKNDRSVCIILSGRCHFQSVLGESEFADRSRKYPYYPFLAYEKYFRDIEQR